MNGTELGAHPFSRFVWLRGRVSDGEQLHGLGTKQAAKRTRFPQFPLENDFFRGKYSKVVQSPRY